MSAKAWRKLKPKDDHIVDASQRLLVISTPMTGMSGSRADRKVQHEGGVWMLYAAWPCVSDDLASTRRDAAAFLESLSVDDSFGTTGRQNWGARWTEIGDAHRRLAGENARMGDVDQATEAWLCGLTAYEVARRLVDEDDPQRADISTKIDADIRTFGLSLKQKVERLEIASCDQAGIPAYYLPAGSRDLSAPAVICISREEEIGATLLGRLLPVVMGRGMSVLAVSHGDISNHWRGQSETLLSCCFDYLLVRPDVDATRIGVYGEGFSAVLATDFAASEHRLAAAVCDGGLWSGARTLASVRWMASTADVTDEDVVLARRSRLVKKLRCPVLVVAGGQGVVSVSEAIKLQAECAASRIDVELITPRVSRSTVGEIENFVTSDDYIFGWLQHKLARGSTHLASRPR